MKHLIFFIILFIFANCQYDDETNNNEKTATECETITSVFKALNSDINLTFKEVEVKFIGDAHDEYYISFAEDEQSYEEEIENLDEVLSSELQTNEENNAVLKTGRFYYFNIAIDTNMTFEDGLAFEIGVINRNFEPDSYQVVDYGEFEGENSDENSTKDESENTTIGLVEDEELENENNESEVIELVEGMDLILHTLIPTNIADGDYFMLFRIIDQNIVINISDYNSETITQEKLIGSVPVSVESDDYSKRVDFVDLYTENEYIDIPKSMEFSDGYTNMAVGGFTLIPFNSTHLEQNVSISATLEINNKSYELGLMYDTDENTTIETKTKKRVVVLNPNEIKVADIPINYYLKESDLTEILTFAPDFSEDLNALEMEALINFHIESENEEIIINDINSSVYVSQYDDEYLYEEESSFQAQSKVLKNEFLGLEKEPQVNFYTPAYDWFYSVKGRTAVKKLDEEKFEDLQKIDHKLEFEGIDAALKWDDHGSIPDFLFFYKKDYVKYRKSGISDTNWGSPYLNWSKVGSGTVSSLLQGRFEEIDAALRINNGAMYFFKDSQYVKRETNGNISGIGNIKNDWGDLLSDNNDKVISSATIVDNFINFIIQDKDEKFYSKVYDLNQNKVLWTKEIEEENEIPIAMASASKNYRSQNNYEAYMFHEVDKQENQGELFSEGILFKKGKVFEKEFGSPSKASIKFEAGYSTIGKWKEMSIEGKGLAEVTSKIFSNDFPLIAFRGEAYAGLTAQYSNSYTTRYDSNDSKTVTSASTGKSKIGAKMEIDIFGKTIYEKSNISEEEKSDEIKDATSKEDVKAKTKEAVTKSKEKAKEKSFSLPNKDWKEKKYLFQESTTIGIIPVSIAGGVNSNFKIDTNFSMEADDSEAVGAYLISGISAGVEGFIDGKLNFKILELGISTVLKFVEAEVTAKAGADFKYKDENQFSFNIISRMKYDLKLLQLMFKLFYKLNIKFWSWDDTKNIWSTDWAFRKTVVPLYFKKEQLINFNNGKFSFE